MMLSELTTLLASDAADRPAQAVVRDNLLGKPSVRAREAALVRLRQLYGIGEDCPICTVMRRLWDRDSAGRPMLALLCALARDPTRLAAYGAAGRRYVEQFETDRVLENFVGELAGLT